MQGSAITRPQPGSCFSRSTHVRNVCRTKFDGSYAIPVSRAQVLQIRGKTSSRAACRVVSSAVPPMGKRSISGSRVIRWHSARPDTDADRVTRLPEMAALAHRWHRA